MARTRKRPAPVDAEVLDTIALLKDTLGEPNDASDIDEDYITASSNRGHKLERGAKNVAMRRLGSASEGQDKYGLKLIECYGAKRAVIYKKRRTVYDDMEEEEIEDLDEDEESPYDEIKLETLLAPITNPSQVTTHPALRQTYTSSILANLAERTLDIICEEQKYVVKLAKLMSVFLGDDPSYLMAENLHLPELPDDPPQRANSSAPTTNTTNNNDNTVPSSTNNVGNGTVGDQPDDESAQQSGRRMVTRQQAHNEMDPFFAPPEIQVDGTLGISHEHAEETRQLTQIVQQRMEEFIRNMTSIRSGILRADRIRNQVYAWCREVGGGDELDDMIANDPETGPPVVIEK